MKYAHVYVYAIVNIVDLYCVHDPINQSIKGPHKATPGPREEATSQRHLRGSKPCVAKRHRLGGL